MKFTIIFIGLISHITLTPASGPQEYVAVLVTGMAHTPQVIVDDAYLDTKLTTMSRSHAGHINIFDVSGHDLKITGLNAAPPMKFSPWFQKYVPSLMQITDGTKVTDDVKTKNLQGYKINGILELPPASLSVRNFFPTKASNLGFVKDCVAHEVQYQADMANSATSVVITAEDGTHINLFPNAEITVQNIPDRIPPTQAVKDEYKEFKALMFDATTIGTWMDSGEACGRVLPPHKLDTVECSNSRFP